MSETNDSSTGGYIIDKPPVPATGDEITEALQHMITQLTGLPGHLVRPRWQPTPPSQPHADITWASIGITHVEADDYPDLVHLGDVVLADASGPGATKMIRHSTLTVVATFYGPESETHAGELRDSLYVGQNYEPLSSVGIKLREVRDLARNAELINQQWIDRFDVEIIFRRQFERYYPILNIDGADVVLHRPPHPHTLVEVRPVATPKGE